jgi:Rod binding domain-containing protein
MGTIEGGGSKLPAASSRTLELRRGEAAPKADAALDAGITQVAQGFDSLFSGILVGELTRPLQAAGFGGSGPGASVIQGMIETHLSDHLSKGDGLGVGRLVADSMRRFMKGAIARSTPAEKLAALQAEQAAEKQAGNQAEGLR